MGFRLINLLFLMTNCQTPGLTLDAGFAIGIEETCPSAQISFADNNKIIQIGIKKTLTFFIT